MALAEFRYEIMFQAPYLIATAVSDPANYDMVSVLSDGVPFVPVSTVEHRIKASIRTHLTENDKWSKYKLCPGQSTDDSDQFCVTDRSDPQAAPCPLCRIFGQPGGEWHAGFDFSGARVQEPHYSILKSIFENTGEAAYSRRPGNSVDDQLRRAVGDKLFFAGLADVQVPLRGSVNELDEHSLFNDEIRRFDVSLILLGLRLINEMGGRSNRGPGECQISVDDSIIFQGQKWRGLIAMHIDEWKNALQAGGA